MSSNKLSEYTARFEELADQHGLSFYPVEFEVVPKTFMMEVAVYGLPVRMPHWSFGVRYIYQYVQHRMGGSKIFEVVFPGNPNRAYLIDANSLAENTLVTAHVIGHADFSRNNELFGRMQSQVGYRIVEQAAERAHRIEAAIERHGRRRVEAVLDAALSLEQHIDIDRGLARKRYPEVVEQKERPKRKGFGGRYDQLPGEGRDEEQDVERGDRGRTRRAPIPPHPEYDLLWFTAQYGPELEEWERDIFLGVREESFYFYPVFACQIMNEGWASYWHARLLREADFLAEDVYLDAAKAHSDVVRPYGGSGSVSLSINPYYVGFVLWEHIVEGRGLDAALQIRAEEDDFGFVRNYLDDELAERLELFTYRRTRHRLGEERYLIEERDMNRLRETILSPKFHYGAPRVYVSELAADGSLTLRHDYETDGRGLDEERSTRVLEYIERVWRRPVRLITADEDGDEEVLSSEGEASGQTQLDTPPGSAAASGRS